jgi:hypothetical protein
MTISNQEASPVTPSQTQKPEAPSQKRRKSALSPELREVLHMLKSLETEFDGQRVSKR